jgi:hypothetical protein
LLYGQTVLNLYLFAHKENNPHNPQGKYYSMWDRDKKGDTENNITIVYDIPK